MTTRASFNGTSAAEMEFEDEWETSSGHAYNTPEFEDEWEIQGGSHYYSPEMEDETARILPLIAKVETRLLPRAMRVGYNLMRAQGLHSGSRSANGVWPAETRNRQISGLFYQLGRIFAQGESEAAAHEAYLFGTNEFETEIAAHSLAQEAALTEVMGAEAAHTGSESEAQALLGAALPLSMRVVGGRIGTRRLTPTLMRVNAQLVLQLHRQDKDGRQLLRAMPAVQRRTICSLNAAQRAGIPVTPALASQVMTGQAARVLSTPQIARRALVRNMMVRRNTVAPGHLRGSQHGTRWPRYPRYPGYHAGTRPRGPGMQVPGYRPGMRYPAQSGPSSGMRVPRGPARVGPFMSGRPVSRPHPSMSQPISHPRPMMSKPPVSRPHSVAAGRPVRRPR